MLQAQLLNCAIYKNGKFFVKITTPTTDILHMLCQKDLKHITSVLPILFSAKKILFPVS